MSMPITFVDDDLSRVDATEVLFGDAAAPRSHAEQRHDREPVGDRRWRQQPPHEQADR
jgi:hypothetical protein